MIPSAGCRMSPSVTTAPVGTAEAQRREGRQMRRKAA